jgi:two-component system phosphate regulon sensor histidine kinase PhoR
MAKRIFITFFSLILIGVVLTFVLSYNFTKDNYLENTKESLLKTAYMVEEIYNNIDISEDGRLQALLEEIKPKINTRVTIIADSGNVLADSETYGAGLENHLDRPEIISAFNGEIGYSTRFSDTIGVDMMYVAIETIKDGKETVIRTSLPLEHIQELNIQLFEKVRISLLISFLIAMILGYYSINRILTPIKKLNLATKIMAEGDFNSRVKIDDSTEIGDLAYNFNILGEKMETMLDELKENENKLQSTLEGILNGVVAIDSSKKIMFMNNRAEEILDCSYDDFKDKHIFELMRNSFLESEIDNLFKDGVFNRVEIEINSPINRIINVYSNGIKNEGEIIGAVVVLDDVTEFRRLENMRKDFVANVSHELKTPLTSIKGFIETLKSGASEDKKTRDRFIDIIDIESTRLSTLIGDLLVLSDIEKHNISNETIDIYLVVNEIKVILNQFAKHKNIQISYFLDDDLPLIEGNVGWLKQMLINLIDNAVKYSPEDTNVILRVIEYDGNVNFHIKDQGIGIPEEDIPRVFERFYRVDKARSKSVGGTGLGLAIVKHVAIAFKGKIKVESSPGEGSEFIISIPVR